MNNTKEQSSYEEKQRLAKAFLSLLNTDECCAFFEDLFTSREIEDLSSRLEVARLLKLGRNYNDIAEKTGASTATISRVSKCLTGANGGYRMVLSRLDNNEVNEDNSIKTDSLTKEEADAIRAVIACFRSGNK